MVAVPRGRAELLKPGCEGLPAGTGAGAACSCWLGRGESQSMGCVEGQRLPSCEQRHQLQEPLPCDGGAPVQPHPVLQWGAEWRAQAGLCCRWEQRES